MSDSEYPFHTGIDNDGIEQTAVCFLPSSGLFLEFQDPDTHDDWARFECPRTGKVVTYNSTLDRAKKVALGGHVWADVPADTWQQFREEYINADEKDHEYAREKMKELTADPPSETGVA